MPASFEQGHFHSLDDYCSDDLESYPAGDVVVFNSATDKGSCEFLTGWAYTGYGMGLGNFGSDDLELEDAGSISSLHNGQRSGDCLLKNGRFH